jgi:hypothetical protein
MRQLLEKYFSLPPKQLNPAEIELITNLIEQIKSFADLPAQWRDYVLANQKEISLSAETLQDKLTNQVLEMIKLRPELLQTIKTPQIETVESRTGHLTSFARNVYARHLMLGTTPPPLRSSERETLLDESRVVPELTVTYAMAIDPSYLPESEPMKKVYFALSTLTSLSPEKMNEQFKKQNFRVENFKLNLKIILTGMYGSQASELNFSLSGDAKQTIGEIAEKIKVIMSKIHLIQDDGFGLTPEARMILLVDDLLQEPENGVVIPVFNHSMLSRTSRQAGRRSKKTDKKKVLVFQDHAIADSRSVIEEELYV